ncbi:DUF1592 domain-containing protein [Rhodopirellula sp. JC639]|uniref:DUF1592 domain-containing protein n=1 Tax=Stieleria mannarensis TaxID=2755585 RepID=UPI001C72910F|nr:DUF1592 domain-containing protein [Rhodopirellula sp. JC639]
MMTTDYNQSRFAACWVQGFLAVLLATCPANSTPAQDTLDDEHAARKVEVEKLFRKDVTRFIKTYCIDCHQNRRPTEAGVNFSPALNTPTHPAFTEQWKRAAARVKAHDMPPEGLDQPSDEERQMFVQWQKKIKFLSPKDPGPFIIRRLTKSEYGNTLQDLFGVDPEIAAALPDEVSGEGYLNSLSPLQLEQYLAIADKVLDQVWPVGEMPSGEVIDRLIGQKIDPGNRKALATAKIAGSLARTMYRRPASEQEIATLLRVHELGRENKLAVEDAFRLMVKATLVSPQFLFITPAEQPDRDAKIVRLDDYQLASRLSYFLWATMPDAELMRLASEGKLHERDTLRGQVTRMLASPKSRALFDGFGAQWLGLDDWRERAFDQDKFPQMNDALRRAMYDEARLLFEDVMRGDLSVATFIDCDFTFVNQPLAEVYSMDDITGQAMQKVTLTNQNRGGILAMPAVLAATSFPNRTSPVNRGVWVLEQVLGEHVPPAPPDVPALKVQDETATENLTMRELTELHRSDPVCANCHRLLDPIGFGLENFDAIGRWRDSDDNGATIDASGVLPDGSRFSTPAELKAMVSGRLDDFARNLAEKMLAYALCRALEGYDEIVVDEMTERVAADGYQMQTLITEVVTSYPFTHRRIQDER